MPIVEPRDLKSLLRPGQRLMGLDPGTKTIGVAVSDAVLMIASPVETIKRRKFSADLEVLRAHAEHYEVGGMVVGLPVSMDGTEGPRCQSVRQFARNILQGMDMPLAFWDERLSTSAVERMLIDEADMSRQRRAQVIDKMAAAYILQGVLDTLARQP